MKDAGPLRGWIDGPLAIDAMRALKLERQGYRVWTKVIPGDITSENRLLVGAPSRQEPRDEAARIEKRLVLNSAIVVAE